MLFWCFSLRSGGGIGDIMKPPEWDDSDFKYRVFYDSSFFFLVIIILLNIIFGIIIDTFGGKPGTKSFFWHVSTLHQRYVSTNSYKTLQNVFRLEHVSFFSRRWFWWLSFYRTSIPKQERGRRHPQQVFHVRHWTRHFWATCKRIRKSRETRSQHVALLILQYVLEKERENGVYRSRTIRCW